MAVSRRFIFLEFKAFTTPGVLRTTGVVHFFDNLDSVALWVGHFKSPAGDPISEEYFSLDCLDGIIL